MRKTPTTIKRGDWFGRLEAIEKAKPPTRHMDEEYRNQSWWLWRCYCGTEKVINASFVTRGRTKSCGCLRRELAQISIANMPSHRHLIPA